ncbi:hypothetical protein FBU59_007288 [Linderina macrospora]|uniref:Uncharacterized protein n=1 Tax=Linderina macrospora TaxID=4868 RepID=A0ACC1IXM3_9FUNG|nr:hypothetical protein FBU59_007288 [Linderina macrospora]
MKYLHIFLVLFVLFAFTMASPIAAPDDGTVIPLPGPGETLFGYFQRLVENVPFVSGVPKMLGVGGK